MFFASIGIAALAMGGAFLLLRPASTSPAETKTFDLEVRQGERAGGTHVMKVNEGDEVVLRVRSDRREQIHLHGYDFSVQLDPNVPTEMRFVADLTGRFQLEVEASGMTISVLEVLPR